MNKIDLAKSQQELERKVDYWKEQIPRAEVLPISALHGLSTDFIFPRLEELLPEGEPFFDKDELTDKPMRFFITEIIREKILQNYSKEVPYSCEVVVEEYYDEPNIVKIRAIIYVMRTTQKGIIIGHQGSKIKKVGTEARIDIEKFVDKKVFLDLFVKVDADWRDKDYKLKKFGYE